MVVYDLFFEFREWATDRYMAPSGGEHLLSKTILALDANWRWLWLEPDMSSRPRVTASKGSISGIRCHFHVAILDMHLPLMSGLESHLRPGRTSPPFPGHGMQPGQRLREDWFPVVWAS